MSERVELAGCWISYILRVSLDIRNLHFGVIGEYVGGYNLNHGYKCTRCNHIAKEPDKRKRGGKTVFHCPACEYPNTMKAWEKPLNERTGRCSTCGNGEFSLKIHKHTLLRHCEKCDEVIDPESGKTIREGEAVG